MPFTTVVGCIGLLYFITIERRGSQFCEIPAMVTNCVNDTLRWFCDSKRLVNKDREF